MTNIPRIDEVTQHIDLLLIRVCYCSNCIDYLTHLDYNASDVSSNILNNSTVRVMDIQIHRQALLLVFRIF